MRLKLLPYQLCLVDKGDYKYVGQIISRETPDHTIMVRRVPDDPATMEEMHISELSLPGGKYKYVHYALVSGRSGVPERDSSYFPVDMLRYDWAAPQNFSVDDNGAHLNEGETEFIIGKVGERPYPQWTPARWSSFGWTIRELNSVKLEKAPNKEDSRE